MCAGPGPALIVIEVGIPASGAEVHHGERIHPVGEQRFDRKLPAEVVVLHDRAQEQLPGELQVGAGAEDVSVIDLLARRSGHPGVVDRGADRRPGRRPEPDPQAQVAHLALGRGREVPGHPIADADRAAQRHPPREVALGVDVQGPEPAEVGAAKPFIGRARGDLDEGLAHEVGVEPRLDRLTLDVAVEVPGPVCHHGRRDALYHSPIGIEAVGLEARQSPQIVARLESVVGAEGGADAPEGHVPVPAPSVAGERILLRQPAEALPVEPSRVPTPGKGGVAEGRQEQRRVGLHREAAQHLVVEAVDAPEADLPVDTHQRSRTTAVHPAVGHQGTEVGVPPEGLPEAQHIGHALPRLSAHAALLERQQQRGVVVAGAEVGDRGATHPADQLAGSDRLVDAPRVDGIDPGAEEVAALLEKGPLLGKEQRKGAVDVHLPGVRLDLAEIRVERRLGSEAVGEGIPGADAHVGRRAGIAKTGARVAGRCQGARLGGHQGGQHLEGATRPDPFQPCQRAHLTEHARIIAAQGGPGHLLPVAAGSVPPEGGPPGLLNSGREAEAGKWNGHLDDVALLGDLSA